LSTFKIITPSITSLHSKTATYSTTTSDRTHQYLGEEQTTNVYAAELTGIQLAMTSTIEHGSAKHQKCVVFVDNQAAIAPPF